MIVSAIFRCYLLIILGHHLIITASASPPQNLVHITWLLDPYTGQTWNNSIGRKRNGLLNRSSRDFMGIL